MTDAADRILWESDEEALYRTARGQEDTLRAEQVESGTTDAGKDQGAREALVERIAAAMRGSVYDETLELGYRHRMPTSLERAQRVLPLVDAEVAAAVSEAQAEIARLTTSLDSRNRVVEKVKRLAQNWQARAKSAEAEVERLQPLVDTMRQWITNCVDPAAVGVEVKRAMLALDPDLVAEAVQKHRVLLAPSPAATTGEADCRCGHTKADHPAPDGDTYCLHCSCAHYLPPVADLMRDTDAVGRLLADIDTQPEPPADRSWVSTEWVKEGPRPAAPAPVSSGEAGTGEAAKPEWWDADHDRPADLYTPPERTYCHVCGVGYTLHVDSLCKRSESRGIRSPRPAPVVTPSAAGSE